MAPVYVVVTLPLNVREMLHRGFNPQFVIFDEAGFLRDPELFHILGQLPKDVRALFVGDHNQLSPPTFTQERRTTWDVSAFERLFMKGYDQTLLNVEYRSHDLIYRPTSEVYYNKRVTSSKQISLHEGIVSKGSPIVVSVGPNQRRCWRITEMLAFLHLPRVQNDTQRDPSGSFFHRQEAQLGVSLARILINLGIKDVLIMSPYRAQVALVTRLWEEMSPQSSVSPRIQTVDASQGSEGDAVIVLITQNTGTAGFLRSAKWTNVMTSSARHFEYFVGN